MMAEVGMAEGMQALRLSKIGKRRHPDDLSRRCSASETPARHY